MFTGSVYFEKTHHGYKVDDFIEYDTYGINQVNSFKHINHVRVQAVFNFTPKRGQFCKRPHKLIEWSK